MSIPYYSMSLEGLTFLPRIINHNFQHVWSGRLRFKHQTSSQPWVFKCYRDALAFYEDTVKVVVQMLAPLIDDIGVAGNENVRDVPQLIYKYVAPTKISALPCGLTTTVGDSGIVTAKQLGLYTSNVSLENKAPHRHVTVLHKTPVIFFVVAKRAHGKRRSCKCVTQHASTLPQGTLPQQKHMPSELMSEERSELMSEEISVFPLLLAPYRDGAFLAWD